MPTIPQIGVGSATDSTTRKIETTYIDSELMTSHDSSKIIPYKYNALEDAKLLAGKSMH